jgi:hypothetical protein
MKEQKMDEHDNAFESYLRQFEPQRPGALTHVQTASFLRLRRWAAAAILVLFLGGSIWIVLRKSLPAGGGANTAQFGAQGQAVSVLPPLPMTQLALENPTYLDAKLSEASRNMLPDFQEAHSTLRVLAKE